MSGILVTVEEYANNKGVTKSAVYKQIKRHAEELQGHIESKSGKMWLDEEATGLLDEASNKSAPVLVDMADKQRAEEIEAENEELKSQLGILREKMNTLMELNMSLTNEKIAMIEELTAAKALVEEHNNLKTKNEHLIEENARTQISLEAALKEKELLETKLNTVSSEVERLQKRNLWQRILNK